MPQVGVVADSTAGVPKHLVAEPVAPHQLATIMLLHPGAPEAAAELAQRCRRVETPITEASASIGTHAGPGAFGVAAVLKQSIST